MTLRRSASLLALLAIALMPASAAAQGRPATAPTDALRTPDGKPDLQGFWDFRTLTPLERPPSQANKAFLTEEEAKALSSRPRTPARALRRRATPRTARERPAVARKPSGL